MGASVSAKVSTVTSAINNEVNKESSASATCDSNIKGTLISFGGDMKSGCEVKLANNCVASAEAASNSVISGATKALNAASQKTKTGFGISASMSYSDIKSLVSSKLNESCDTDAKVNNSIEDNVIMINGDCDGKILLVNTGNAKANCMTKAVLDTINQAEDSSKSETTGFGGDLIETAGKNPLGSGISSIVCSYSSCCSICIILLVLGVIAYMNFGMDMDMGMNME